MHPLLSCSALSALLERDRTGLVLLDATTVLPGERFDPEAAFRSGHLPGARRFDIEAFSDPEASLPHMAPSQARFARLIAALGVSNESLVVFYDQTGMVSAARAWWLAGLFGHDRACVLDGGLPAWRDGGHALESGEPADVSPGVFMPALRSERLVGLGDMKRLSCDGGAHVLDARSRGRFEATVPEPRPGLPAGHIPGSVNLPFGELLRDGRLLPPDALRARFEAAGVGAGDRVVTSCGSGLTASVLSLGLAACGLGPGALYDGSWTEWAQAGMPRQTGEAR